MTVLVTGARGILGRRVVAQLAERGHLIRTAGRSKADVKLDLSDGIGLTAALAAVEAVFHCATSPFHHRRVDRDGTGRLLKAAEVPVIYPGIVGTDVIPLPYYESKVAAEGSILAHPPGAPSCGQPSSTSRSGHRWVASSGCPSSLCPTRPGSRCSILAFSRDE